MEDHLSRNNSNPIQTNDVICEDHFRNNLGKVKAQRFCLKCCVAFCLECGYEYHWYEGHEKKDIATFEELGLIGSNELVKVQEKIKKQEHASVALKKQTEQLLELEQNITTVSNSIADVFTLLRSRVDTLEEEFKLNCKNTVNHLKKECEDRKENQLIKDFNNLKNSLVNDKLSNWNNMSLADKVETIKNLKPNEELLSTKLLELDMKISVTNVNNKLQDTTSSTIYKKSLICLLGNKAELDTVIERVEELIKKCKRLDLNSTPVTPMNNLAILTPQSTNRASTENLDVKSASSNFLISIKSSSTGNLGEAFLVRTNNINTVVPIQLDESSFVDTRTVNMFPPDFTKFVNIGRSIIITGGFDKIRGIALDNSWVLIPEESEVGFKARVFVYPSMRHRRERHNMIYLPNVNIVMVCGGFYTNTAEYLDLTSLKNWESIPNMRHSRGNATMAYINQSHVYCISGFEIIGNNRGVYLNSIETLDVKNMSKGWSSIAIEGKFSLASELKLCAMGVITRSDHQILLVGGYDGSKYIDSIYEVTFDPKKGEMTKLAKLTQKLTQGTIFQSNATYSIEGNRAYNFDYRCKLLIFDNEKGNFLNEGQLIAK